MTVQLATFWNSTTPAAPSGRQNIRPQTDNATPIANASWNIPNIGGVEYRVTATEVLGQADQGKIITFSFPTVIAVTIDNPTDTNWMCSVFIVGAGTAIFTPASGTINSVANVSLIGGQNGVIAWDGTNWVLSLTGGPGTGLLLQTNGTNNASQTKLNLIGGTGVIVTDGGAGAITLSLSAGGAGPNPTSRRWAYGTPSSGAISATGNNIGDRVATGGTESFAAAGATAGGVTLVAPVSSYATSASSGTNASIASALEAAATGWTVVGQNMLWTARVFLSAITSVRVRVGVGAPASGFTTWLGSDSLTTTTYAAFRFSTVAGDTNFMCETGDGAAVNTVSSGIAVAASTLYNLQIKFNDATPNVVFSVNGTIAYTSTLHLPGAGTGLSYLMGIQTQANAIKTMFIEWIYEESDS